MPDGPSGAVFTLKTGAVLLLGPNQAMDLLRQAVAKGYKDAAHVKKDTDLDPIRNREDFKRLIVELEAKKK